VSKRFFAVIAAAAALSCAAGPRTLTGYVKIYGSEPHTYAGIAAGDKVYAVYPPEKEAELRSLQGLRLEFTVRPVDPPQGPGAMFLKDGCVEPLSWKPALD
jgi:hypothetical protein